ncbi:hypothetical protein [Flammeovirga sp. SubArs3]|uniref:alpha/beta hydrolase n=1 Tax=Flammeovirga sp. SubArs3 TaxID=2995316 RepID=UPI00248AF0CD|nr:hypothetical protein [Flammeovirga sp. SubArs3]
MENQKEWVSIKMDAPFYTNGNQSEETEHLWFLFHGYGQLAEHFMRRFDIVDPKKHHVVALQGLSRFYLDNKYEKIGASWMTRMEREKDIIHQKRYIDEVYYDRLFNTKVFDIKKNFFAFSQGGATLMRWLKNTQPEVDSIVMWGADFPHELSPEDFSFLNEEVNLIYVIGENDPFLEMIKLERIKKLLNDLTCNTEIVTFKGGHHVHRETLQKIINKLYSK